MNDSGSIDNCTGECCSRFPIGGCETSDEVFIMLDNIENDCEALKLIEMLIVIPPDSKLNYVTFTCKHWNRETRLCMNYENRPLMCSDYPYDSSCKHCGAITKANADENYQNTYPYPKQMEFVEFQEPK